MPLYVIFFRIDDADTLQNEFLFELHRAGLTIVEGSWIVGSRAGQLERSYFPVILRLIANYMNKVTREIPQGRFSLLHFSSLVMVR
jgi:hypothetical protein